MPEMLCEKSFFDAVKLFSDSPNDLMLISLQRLVRDRAIREQSSSIEPDDRVSALWNELIEQEIVKALPSHLC